MTSIAPPLGRWIGAWFGAVMNIPEHPMRWAQSHLRDGRLGWLFVAPNLAVFGLFTFLPIAINLWYSLTGGTELLPGRRPYVGAKNFATLLTCQSYIDPNSCARDLFWHGVWNTAKPVSCVDALSTTVLVW